jgi:hypothetical protein
MTRRTRAARRRRPTLFGNLLHALGYLLGRGVGPQFCTNLAHARRQIHRGLAAAAKAGPIHPAAWEMAFRTNGHGERRGHSDRRLDTRLGRLRLRIRLAPELRMQKAVLIHAPDRQPPLLDHAHSHQDLQAPPLPGVHRHHSTHRFPHESSRPSRGGRVRPPGRQTPALPLAADRCAGRPLASCPSPLSWQWVRTICPDGPDNLTGFLYKTLRLAVVPR